MNNLTELTEIGLYDFPWQAPLAEVEAGCFGSRRYNTIIEPDDLSVLERKLFDANPDDFEWAKDKIKDLPDYLTKYFVTRYISVFEKKGRKDANIFLRERMGPAAERALMVLRKYKKLPTTQKVSLLSEEFIDTEQSDFAPKEQMRFDFEKAERNRKPVKSRLLAELEPSEVKNMAFKISQITKAKFPLIAAQVAHYELDEEDIQEVIGYEELANFVKQFGIAPPRKKKKQTALTALNDISRMLDEKWWYGRLNKTRKIMREHLAIAMGQVSSKASPYASWDCVREHQAQQTANYAYIKQCQLLDEETGEEADLWDMVKKSVANPAIRRHELMVRCRGCEDIGNELGLQGLFLTLTTPSKYHNSYKKGGFIDHWNGASPRDAQSYLNNVWQRIRAKLGREEIRWFGVRVAEPHHDGTPHWHLLIWVQPEDVMEVRDIFISYATDEDRGELHPKLEKEKKKPFRKGAYVGPLDYRPRCDFGFIDPDKGTATGYIAKYISKNIDGFAMDDEISDETGKPVKDMAKNVSAWKSRWSIRQFQFFGGAPVTTYRELRRFANQNKKAFMEYLFMQERVDLLTIYSMLQRDLVGPIKPSKLITNEELMKVIGDSYQSRTKAQDSSVTDTLKAADEGNWQGYIMGQGGPFVRRQDLLIINSYEVLPFASPHGEDVRKIEGFTTHEETIKTRTKVWTIQKKSKAITKGSEATAIGASGSSRSSVNNCTHPHSGKVPGRTLSPEVEYAIAQLIAENGLDPSIKTQLSQGCWVQINKEKSVRVRFSDNPHLPCTLLHSSKEPDIDLSWLATPGQTPTTPPKPRTPQDIGFYDTNYDDDEFDYQQPNLSHLEHTLPTTNPWSEYRRQLNEDQDDWPLA